MCTWCEVLSEVVCMKASTVTKVALTLVIVRQWESHQSPDTLRPRQYHRTSQSQAAVHSKTNMRSLTATMSPQVVGFWLLSLPGSDVAATTSGGLYPTRNPTELLEGRARWCCNISACWLAWDRAFTAAKERQAFRNRKLNDYKERLGNCGWSSTTFCGVAGCSLTPFPRPAAGFEYTCTGGFIEMLALSRVWAERRLYLIIAAVIAVVSTVVTADDAGLSNWWNWVIIGGSGRIRSWILCLSCLRARQWHSTVWSVSLPESLWKFPIFLPYSARSAGTLLGAGDTSFSKGAYSAAIKNYGKFIGTSGAALAAKQCMKG